MQIKTGYNLTSLTQILSAEPTDLEWDAIPMILDEISLKKLREIIKEGSKYLLLGIYAVVVAIQGTISEIVLNLGARTTEVDNYHLLKSFSN